MAGVVVVGGGLAGLTAACELLERGCKVTIIEKNANLGGNASKATCGIAVPGSSFQREAGVEDTAADLMAEGPAAKALITNGSKDVEWLTSAIGVKDEMSLRLTPGHGKTARTLGTKTHFPGAVVTYAVIHVLESIAQAKPDLLQIITGASVTRILTQGSKVTGVEFNRGQGSETLQGLVLLSTGGFAGDSSPNSILAQVAPALLNMPSTNDERFNGDGIRLGAAVGAATEKLNHVSIYPTTAVIPGQEAEKFKIVVSDAICGAGGKLINAEGAQFVDELASAQVRSDAMMKGKGPFRLVIAEKDSESVQWLCDFYTTRKVMKKYSSDWEMAGDLKIPASSLLHLGAGPLYVAMVTPALYSCGGGLSTSFDDSNTCRVLSTKGVPIEGLFAAGELASAPYPGLWAVSGMPLLHCVYTGRCAGRSAAAALGATAVVTPMNKIATSADAPKSADALKVVEEKKKPEDMTKDELIEYVKKLEAAPPPAAAAAAVPVADLGISMAEVAKHNTKADAWIVLMGEVLDVTQWISIHPGGEKAIESYLGTDATEEWQMIHKPGTVEKNLQYVKKMGKVGGGAAAAVAGAVVAADSGMSMAEVEKHNTNEDAWVVLFGTAYDVTKWIPIHPGGEQAIKAFLGKDATEEWQMIHKPGTIEKNMQYLVDKGKVSGVAAIAQAAPAAGDDDPPAKEGNGGIPGVLGALVFLLMNVLSITLKSVFFTGNFKFSLDNNRKGTIRSAIFLITFILVHALGNFADMLGGPKELNGEGYLFDRIHWTGGLGLIPDFSFSIVEEYLALALLLHVSVALKRSWDISLNYTIGTGKWNMLLSGSVVLYFLQHHLQDFRFYPDYEKTMLWAPDHLIAFDGVLSGRVFSELEGNGELVKVRDIYSHEVVLFKNIDNVLLYTVCITLFVTHMCLGWKKLIPADAMQIPRDHQKTVIYMGWVAAMAVAGMYLSVPWYVYFAEPQVVVHVA